MSDYDRQKAMIEAGADAQAITPLSWRRTEDERPEATFGRFSVLEDSADESVFEGDEGLLTAHVVGHRNYGNERVAFFLTVDGTDTPVEVDPGELAGLL